MTTQKQKIQYLNPAAIAIPAVRIDSSFDKEIFEMFQADVQKVGIEQPLLVAKTEDGLFVIDGRHRLEEALRLRLTTVPCLVREMDLKSLQLRNLVSNRLRGKTKVSEEIKVIADLYHTYGTTIEEIVDKTGMKRERIETLILISEAVPDVLASLDKEKISVCSAFQLTRLPDHDRQYRMLQIFIQYDVTCSKGKELVDEALRTIKELSEKAGSPAPPGPPQVPVGQCTICMQEVPLRELTSPIMCRGCYSLSVQAYQEVRRMEDREAAAAKGQGLMGQPIENGSGGGT